MSLVVSHRPSPNFNARTQPVSMLVLHYTGMKTGEAAIERLCDPDAGVSAHYVVEEDGRVLQLVAESDRAWHAGRGAWAGVSDVNSASIGIEIVNGGHEFGLPPFPALQIESVITLCRDILGRHPIAPTNIIGHSDMAPNRKEDPGERFPWAQAAAAGIGLWPGDEAPADGIDDVASALQTIGYPLDDEVSVEQAITAFQRRFRPSRVDGAADGETRKRVGQVLQAYRS